MEQIQKWKAAITGLLGGLTALWGWFGWLVAGWAACMLLDYLTGSLAAAKAGAWSSQAAREGIWHKAGMVAVVLVAAGTDLLLALVLEHLPVAALPLEYLVFSGGPGGHLAQGGHGSGGPGGGWDGSAPGVGAGASAGCGAAAGVPGTDLSPGACVVLPD